MTDKVRMQHPALWLEDRCVSCNHVSETIYRPDLLNGAVEKTCQRDSLGRGICGNQWSVAVGEKGKHDILDLLETAKELDDCYARTSRLRKKLGYEY
jgi:hypothetical protein